jgi:hypothetical protein
VLNAPLITGNDVRSMDDATRRILLNRDLLAVNQDWSGTQGRKVRDDGDHEVWAKPMSDRSVAVVLLNRGAANASIGATAAELGLPTGSWRHGGRSPHDRRWIPAPAVHVHIVTVTLLYRRPAIGRHSRCPRWQPN